MAAVRLIAGFVGTVLALASAGTLRAQPNRNIAGLIIAEGLKARAARAELPGTPVAVLFAMPAGWLDAAKDRRTPILLDVRAVLRRNDEEAVRAFTVAVGPAGVKGEALYAAWVITGYWLAHGETYDEIARVEEKDAPARVAEAIDKMLAEPGR